MAYSPSRKREGIPDMKLHRRAALAALSFCIVAPAFAQTTTQYPQRAVKLILPFGPGTATDIAARMIGEKLATKWGKPVVIENRAGGDGLIAIRAFLQAADDHTLLYSSSASFIAHPYTLQTKPPYDMEKDLLPIARTTDTVLAVSVPTALPVKTLAEFVEYAKQNPGKLNGAGAAGLPEFSIAAFIQARGLQVTKVPYRDVVQAGQDLSENRIQILASSYAVVLPHAQAGKVRILSTGAAKRTSLAPDLPSPNEAGFPELAIETTVGFYGPAGMPRDLRVQISKDILGTLGDKEFVDRLTATGQVVNGQGPDELAAALKEQAAAAKRLADILGIKPKE
jgi:tripartite-type tricarboxylate transporter receptor subunit TctC